MIEKDAKILIVDDMKMIRTSIKKFLKTLGYENTIEASNGNEAVKQHKSHQPAIIFMDVVMPELNGNEALKQMREQDQSTPIVMLTSVSDKKTIDECEQLGVAGYIIKPLTVKTGPDALQPFLS